MPELTIEVRRVLVQEAISHVERCKAEWERINADPRAGSAAIVRAKGRLKNAEDEFGWQWKNVKILMEQLVPRRGDAVVIEEETCRP